MNAHSLGISTQPAGQPKHKFYRARPKKSAASVTAADTRCPTRRRLAATSATKGRAMKDTGPVKTTAQGGVHPGRPSGCLWAFLGAVLAPPASFLLAFAWGTFLGAGGMMATAASRPSYGMEGGYAAALTILWIYYISFGILPLVISVAGASLSLAVSRRLRPKCSERTIPLAVGAAVAVNYVMLRLPMFELRWRWEFLVSPFLLAGPLSALLAGVLARWYPKAGAALFLIGAICSAGLALADHTGDWTVRLLIWVIVTQFLVSFPMLGVGAWLFLTDRKGGP